MSTDYLRLGSVKFRIMSTVLFMMLVLIIGIASYFVLKYNRQQVLEHVAVTLEAVAQTTTVGLKVWVGEKKSYLGKLSHNAELIHGVQELLRLPVEQDGLATSPALEKIRAVFRKEKKFSDDIGFFVINTDFISIGSMRNANVGTINIIAKNYKHLLDRVFNGETLFIHPIRSDVLLDADNLSKKLPPSIFIATPIYNEHEHVIAVLTIRLKLDDVFMPIIQRGHIGNSGETYAFSREGVMLSESRFSETMAQLGLLAQNQSSILEVEIRDPGVNLMEGFLPPASHSQQPLTLMAKSAIQEGSGTNIEGYRDYRGVPVFGSWIWDEVLGIGIATEVDQSEALANYNIFRITTLAVLAVSVALFMFSFVFIVIFGEKTTKDLRRSSKSLPGADGRVSSAYAW